MDNTIRSQVGFLQKKKRQVIAKMISDVNEKIISPSLLHTDNLHNSIKRFENNICMHTHIQFQLHGIFLCGNHMEERSVDRLQRKQNVAHPYSVGQDAVQEDEWLEELSLE